MDFKVPLVLSILLSISFGFLAPPLISHFDDSISSITILEAPSLLKALQDAQSKGALMAIHGVEVKDYSDKTSIQAKQTAEINVKIFRKAGLNPAASISDSGEIRQMHDDVIKGVETVIVPQLGTEEATSYGQGWSNISDSRDPRFQWDYERIKLEEPTYILLRVEDWNPLLKLLISGYLGESNQTGITIAINGIDANTPAKKISDIAEMLQYGSVGHIIYVVNPTGTWKGGDPEFFGFSVDTIFGFYWWFYVIAALLPLSFFVFWRFATNLDVKGDEHRYLSLNNIIRTEDVPSVTIIIPAYNEEKSVGKCLTAVQIQDFKGKMDVIVINDGSTDRTAEFASKYPVTLINLRHNVGKAKALNIGVSNSKGDILIFSDSDSYLASDAVSSIIKCFKEHPVVHAVAGNILIDESRGKANILTQFQILEYRIEQEINRNLQSLSGRVLICPGPLFAVRRIVIEGVLFSDRSIIEDAEFTVRVLQKSMKIIREPAAKAYTEVPESLGDWANQRIRWWFGGLQIWNMHNSWAKNLHGWF